MSKIIQNNPDDYHFLNDIETGFSTSNPMNNTSNSSFNHYDNTRNNINHDTIYLFERMYKPCTILVCIFITTGLGFMIYLFISKL